MRGRAALELPASRHHVGACASRTSGASRVARCPRVVQQCPHICGRCSMQPDGKFDVPHGRERRHLRPRGCATVEATTHLARPPTTNPEVHAAMAHRTAPNAPWSPCRRVSPPAGPYQGLKATTHRPPICARPLRTGTRAMPDRAGHRSRHLCRQRVGLRPDLRKEPSEYPTAH